MALHEFIRDSVRYNIGMPSILQNILLIPSPILSPFPAAKTTTSTGELLSIILPQLSFSISEESTNIFELFFTCNDEVQTDSKNRPSINK